MLRNIYDIITDAEVWYFKLSIYDIIDQVIIETEFLYQKGIK
jgi:hypothetical protein